MKKYLTLAVFVYLLYWFSYQAYHGLVLNSCAFPTTQPQLSLYYLTGDNALYCGILYAFIAFILVCTTIIIAFTLKAYD